MSFRPDRFLQKYRFDFLCLGLVFLASTSVFAAGINDKFNYDSTCKLDVAALKTAYSKGAPTKAAAQRQLDTNNLYEDLGNLDAQVKIITDQSEEIDFRYQVVKAAETTRQSVIYSMDRIRKFAPLEFDKIELHCGLSGIKAPFLWPQLAEDLEKSFSALPNPADGKSDSSAIPAE